MVGFHAVNLGREKSVAAVIDRSQSMLGQAMTDASAAAREFVGTKPGRDRVAVFAVGRRAVQLTSFSSTTAEADAALRTIAVDKVRGTALYDSVVLASQALAADINQTRILVLLTDGQEVSSDASLEQAIAAARAANAAVYPIGIESASFRPGPLQRLAQKTRRPLRGRQRDEGPAGRLRHRSRRSCAGRGSSPMSLRLGPPRAPGRGRRRDRRVGAFPAWRPNRRPEASKLPSPSFKIGPLLTATIVGFLILLASCSSECARPRVLASGARSHRISARRRASAPAARCRNASRPRQA